MLIRVSTLSPQLTRVTGPCGEIEKIYRDRMEDRGEVNELECVDCRILEGLELGIGIESCSFELSMMV